MIWRRGWADIWGCGIASSMTKPLAHCCKHVRGAIELHRVSPLGAYAFRGMQWTLHRAGVVEAEIVVVEELVIAYLRIGVGAVAEIWASQEARRETTARVALEA